MGQNRFNVPVFTCALLCAVVCAPLYGRTPEGMQRIDFKKQALLAEANAETARLAADADEAVRRADALRETADRLPEWVAGMERAEKESRARMRSERTQDALDEWRGACAALHSAYVSMKAAYESATAEYRRAERLMQELQEAQKKATGILNAI